MKIPDDGVKIIEEFPSLRTEKYSTVEKSNVLLTYYNNKSTRDIARAPNVYRAINKTLSYWIDTTLNDNLKSITDEAITYITKTA